MPVSILNDTSFVNGQTGGNNRTQDSRTNLRRNVSISNRAMKCPELLLNVFDLAPTRSSTLNSQGPTINSIIIQRLH